jgi:hypothetical protein
MSASSHRRTRFAMLAVTSITAVSVVACGSSHTASPASSSPAASPAAPSTPPPATGQARVRGLIASVSGNTAQVTQEKGDAAVAFTASTKVTELTPAALGDVTTGSCVTVRPAHRQSEPGQPLTAAGVRVSPAVDGKCPTTPAKRAPVQGAVASVAGNTITVTRIDPSGAGSQATVTVTDQTRYTKQAGADIQAIAQGKCMTAQGNRDGSGTLQATTIDLRPARDGTCGGQHRLGG